jgi:serine/threonine-protein phosphatase PGAM5
MAQRMLFLIRHGQYESTPDDGELGGLLTDLGKQQAQVVGAALSGLNLSAIHCSSMRRAEETAQIISQLTPTLDPTPTRLLWELIPTIPPHLEEVFQVMAAQNPYFNIEDVLQNREYADQAFDTFFRPSNNSADNLALVCHGNIIRYFVCLSLGINPDKWSDMYINHCSLTSILVEPNGNRVLTSYNETGHLPKHMKTEH